LFGGAPCPKATEEMVDGLHLCEQECGHWRSHVFLWSLLVPVAPSKLIIPPCDRLEMLFGQPFASVGF
jgi:hypothetical protein